MPRARKGAARRLRHQRILEEVKGFYGATSRRVKLAIQKGFRARQMATRGRKLRKRDFRALWITRLSAACEQRGIRYSQFIHALHGASITLNRKMLSEIAIADPAAFDAVVAAAMKPAAL